MKLFIHVAADSHVIELSINWMCNFRLERKWIIKYTIDTSYWLDVWGTIIYDWLCGLYEAVHTWAADSHRSSCRSYLMCLSSIGLKHIPYLKSVWIRKFFKRIMKRTTKVRVNKQGDMLFTFFESTHHESITSLRLLKHNLGFQNKWSTCYIGSWVWTAWVCMLWW